MKQTIKILKIIIPIGIGVYLTWLFLSGLNKDEISQVKASFLNANYLWVIAGLIVAFLSHLSRAKRWLFLVKPLGYRPKLSNAYHGIMSGYIINYTIPRSGEFARAGLMTKYENLPFEKGFGTIVIERVFDLIMLGLVILVTGLMQVDSGRFNQIMQTQESGTNGFLFWMIMIGCLLGVIGLIFYLKNEKFRSFTRKKSHGLWVGLKSFQKMDQKWRFLGHTIFIWLCYVGSVWIFAQAFSETENMPIECIFGAFVVGSAAITILPGGLGAYPLWVNSVLTIYGINFAGFGFFMWVISASLIVILGLISLFLIQRQ